MKQFFLKALGTAALVISSALPALAQGDLFVRQIAITAEQAAFHTPRPADTSALEMRLVDAVMRSGNAERLRAGLGALTTDPALSEAARRYSIMMRDQNFFAHVSPSGETLAERLPRHERGRFAKLGENLWSGEGALDWRAEPIARQTAEDWILSPSHRDNLLESVYTMAGVGAAISGQKVYVTMLYARPHGDPVYAKRLMQNPTPPADLYGFSRQAETAMLASINAERALRGASALVPDYTLGLNALEHARNAMSIGDVQASSAGGESILRKVLNEQPGRLRSLSMALWQASGGLIWEQSAMADEALKSWRTRADTLTDLTDPRYDTAGIGFATDGSEVFVSVLLSERALNTAASRTVILPSATSGTYVPMPEGLRTRSGGQYITIE